MGKNSHTIKLSIGLLVSLFLVWACTKKAEFINPPTKLKIQVLKEGGVPLKNARVGIFSDEVVYELAKGNYGIESADFHDTTDAAGFVYFDSVSSDIRYYVLSKYDSVSTTASGKDTIAWSNIAADYQFLNPLKANTVTTAQVYISPSDGFINFWTTNVYVARQQPIEVKVGGISFQPINQIGISNGVKRKLRAGKYIYQAKSIYGCVWIDTVEVIAGQTVNEELRPCTMVPVSIMVTGAANDPRKFPIRVVLNGTDTLKESIIRPLSSTQFPDCGTSGSISIVRPDGTYSYQFIAADKTVVIGTTTFAVPTQGLNCDTLIVNYK